MPQGDFEHRKSILVFSIMLVLVAAVCAGAGAGYFIAEGDRRAFCWRSRLFFLSLPPRTCSIEKRFSLPAAFGGRQPDAPQTGGTADTKDDLFIKFLGVYDVNYAANSPRLFAQRLTDVADITSRVMESDACFIYLFDKPAQVLTLAATNGVHVDAIGNVRIPLGEGIEGWVGRRLEPIILKDYHADTRFKEIAGISLDDYRSVYCLPLYVYSNGALVGLMELFYRKVKSFSDEEINFFTTLSGLLSTTIQNEQMQIELRKMNMELEQWVAEKTEELRSSEERYRTLVENASESIFVLAENGDIIFANEQAARLTGHAKYDLLHKNLFEFFLDPARPREVLVEVMQGRGAHRHGDLLRTDGAVVPVDVSAVGLSLMGKRFVQSVVRDVSDQVRLERLLLEKDRELAELKARMISPS
jgi:PAS domain S-box-containing protein